MKIVIESQMIHKGKKINLYNYHYTDSDNERISRTFQASLEKINEGKEHLKKCPF
jgi:hypothetical protein